MNQYNKTHTGIRVSFDTKAKLDKAGFKGETYDDIIIRLLKGAK